MKRQKTSEDVQFKPVFETLGIDEDGSSKGEQESYNVEEFIEDFKILDQMLSLVNGNLDGIVRKYEKDSSDRAEIEMAYTTKIDTLAHKAKLISPLTTYGRDMLKEIRKCSREYETFVSPLITRITEKNIDSFTSVLTADLKEDVAIGKLKALGAVRQKNGELFGAGAIVYKVDQAPYGDQNIGRILWLYVHQDFRGQGIANHLVAELLAAMLEQKIDHITMYSPIGDGSDKEKNRINAYLMSSWLFELETNIYPDSMIRIGDVKNLFKLKDYSKGGNSISSLKKGISSNGVKNALKRFRRPVYLSNKLLDKKGYIDPELSYYIGSETSIRAILLAHRLPSGMIRVEYLKSETDSLDDLKVLISCFIRDAALKNPDDTVLYIPVDSMEIGLFLEEISPVQLGQYMLEGLLTPAIAYDEDVDKRTVKDLLEATH